MEFVLHDYIKSVTWCWNSASDPDKDTDMKPYDDFDSKTIELMYQNFKDKGEPQLCNIGGSIIVDLKNMVQYRTHNINL